MPLKGDNVHRKLVNACKRLESVFPRELGSFVLASIHNGT